MKAGIVFDAWKLPIFERVLKAAGYAFTNEGRPTPDTIALTVITEDAHALKHAVESAQVEAARAAAATEATLRGLC